MSEPFDERLAKPGLSADKTGSLLFLAAFSLLVLMLPMLRLERLTTASGR